MLSTELAVRWIVRAALANDSVAATIPVARIGDPPLANKVCGQGNAKSSAEQYGCQIVADEWDTSRQWDTVVLLVEGGKDRHLSRRIVRR